MEVRLRSEVMVDHLARSQLHAYAANTLAIIAVDPFYFVELGDGPLQASQELLKGLDLLASRDESVQPLLHRLLSQFPTELSTSDRLCLVTLASGWLQDELDTFAGRDELYQKALLKITRVVIRWTRLSDNVNGFIELLMEAVFSRFLVVKSLATMCLSTYASLQDMRLSCLFTHFEEALGARLARRFLGLPCDDIRHCTILCIREFHFGTVEHFMSSLLPYVLQPLVCDGSPPALEALDAVAQLLHPTLPPSKNPLGRMLCGFFEFLLPVMIVKSRSSAELEQALTTIERLAGQPRHKLINKDIHRIHNELLLYLDDAESNSKVLTGLKFIAKMQGDELKTEKDISEYLQPRFLSFVLFADLKLTDFVAPVRSKRRVLRSFTVLIAMMGHQHISSVRIKLLAILKFVLQTFPPELQPTCFEAWRAFIRTLDMASLKSILSQIAVILVPFIRTNPEFAVELFEYLIVKNRQYLHDHFQELFFLPRVPSMAKVSAVLEKYNPRVSQEGRSFQHGLMEQLQFVDIMDTTNKVTHNQSLATDDRRLRVPQMEVRQYALRKLKMLIRNNQEALRKMISEPDVRSVAADESTPISRLMVTLMSCCREAVSPQERHRFGEVMGAIGAIDPDWVEERDSPHVTLARWLVFPSVCHPEFAINLLKELVKGYMTSDKTVQDACGLVIQEALKFYNLRDSNRACIEPDKEEALIWQALSRDYQEVLSPFLTSRYRFILPDHEESEDAAEPPRNKAVELAVLFGSTPVWSTYSDWVRSWTVAMIDRITADMDDMQGGKPEKASESFATPGRKRRNGGEDADAVGKGYSTSEFLQQCIHLVQHDLTRCVTLMPYAVLFLLVHCKPAVKEKMFVEIETVLRSSSPADDSNLDEKHSAVQAVLSLLEFLSAWCVHPGTHQEVRREQLQLDPTLADTRVCDQLIFGVEHFVGRFSQDLLAQASFACHAYAKALMHYEQHLCKQDAKWLEWRNQPEALDFLQQKIK